MMLTEKEKELVKKLLVMGIRSGSTVQDVVIELTIDEYRTACKALRDIDKIKTA